MRDGIISEEMKSRLIKAGLPATYEELIILAATIGIPADILINEEGWAQLPTYLSKANLMDDVTEEAIWGYAADRTVNAALKMLADVAYGRVATLKLTILDTTGAPVPDVTVKLDSAPVVGTDPITDTDGKITISTNGGQHTLYLVYPMGFTVETANQAVEISGTRDLTINTAVRRADSYTFKITASKSFYIARHLSPVKMHLFGGGGAGALRIAYLEGSSSISCQGGAGGYANLQESVDVAGKLIRAIVGAGGKGFQTTSRSYSRAGGNGGTTTVYVGDQVLTANGGAGGKLSGSKNTDGGAAGGAGSGSPMMGDFDGESGQKLFGTGSATGGGGGGSYLTGNDYVQYGTGGSGGGTDANAAPQGLYDDVITQNAVTAGGSGGCAVNIGGASTATFGTGNGGPGIVAFKKAV